MKHPDFAEQKNADTRTFSFTDLSTKTNKQRLDIRPANRTTRRTAEYLGQGSMVLSLHKFSTIFQYHLKLNIAR
ncbi:hypothetical protein LJR231_002151 [Phyllobacterium sp. LjRoot231]|uniref:hypothetical protein n=1 Tax=Phyllobacterium sp. LjRoot231 TaxID=3342289 RepID=UPI003ECF119B